MTQVIPRTRADDRYWPQAVIQNQPTPCRGGAQDGRAGSIEFDKTRFLRVIRSASRAFGLPSTIRTCDLRLRSCKNEVKQL